MYRAWLVQCPPSPTIYRPWWVLMALAARMVVVMVAMVIETLLVMAMVSMPNT